MIEIDHLARVRELFTGLVRSVPEEQLFLAPDGFNNHIAWNAAHVVIVQQLLHYRLAGLDPYLRDELIAKYRKGTGAEEADRESFREVMAFATEAPKRLRQDYEDGRFQGFETYSTSAGIELTSIEDAIAFNQFHEGIHLGYILAQRKALGL